MRNQVVPLLKVLLVQQGKQTLQSDRKCQDGRRHKELWGSARTVGRGAGRSRDKCQGFTEGATFWLRLRSCIVARKEGQMEQCVKDESMWCFQGPGQAWDGCLSGSKKWIPFERNKERRLALCYFTSRLAVYSVFRFLQEQFYL